MRWCLPNYEPFVGAHYCLWYKGDWTNPRIHGSRTEYTPIRGSYQSSDERVIKEHVEEAKSHGINVFVCSWMPPEKGKRKVTPLEVSPWNAIEPNYEDNNLAKLIDIAEEVQDFYVVVILEWNRLREEFMEDATYALYREDTKGIDMNGKPLPYPALTRSATLNQYKKNMIYLLRRYGKRDSWLRLIGSKGERPVISFFPTSWGPSYDQESLEKWHEFLESRYETISKLNEKWNTKYDSFEETKPFSIPLKKSLEHFRDSVIWICKETEKFFKSLEEYIKNKIGIKPYFIGLQPPINPLDMLRYGVHPRYVRDGLDGFFDYCFADIRVGLDYKRFQPSLYTVLRKGILEEVRNNGWFLGLMVNSGWDDRYIVPHGRKIDEFIPRSPLRLHSCFIEALRLNPDGIFVCSYNEWWENSGIESTVEFKDTYLKIVKYYVEKYKSMKLSEVV